MFRTIIGFTVGFVAAKIMEKDGGVKESAQKVTESAREKAARIKSAASKALAAAREELRGDAPIKEKHEGEPAGAEEG